MSEILLRRAYHVATLDALDTRFEGVDILAAGGRIRAIGPDLPPALPGIRRETVDAGRCVILPGLVNTHHHLFQTLQRAVPHVQEAKLFDWLLGLYPIWRSLSPEAVYWSTLLGGAELLLTGCTTTSDHHYLFPRDAPAELLDAQFEAASRLGIRLHATRGSMSLGASAGGLPPDDVVQDEDAILADCERVIDRWHDPAPFAMRRVALAPCAPFNVSLGLMRSTIELARRRGVRAHTHLGETEDENRFCLERYGKRPLQLMQELGWLGPDVWYAHGVCFTPKEMDVLAAAGTGIAHCPTSNMRLASGIAPVPEMLRRGVPIGLAVDGSASNDSSNMLAEVRQAMLLARVGFGPDAMTAAGALRLATTGSAALLGRGAELGSIEIGKAADLILIDVSGLDRAGALADPLAAVVFTGIGQRVHASLVAGKIVVRDGRLVCIDEMDIARHAHAISTAMLRRAGYTPRFAPPPWLNDGE